MIKFWTEKNNKNWLQTTGAAVAVSFLFTIVAAPFAQASIWQERKTAVEQLKKSSEDQENNYTQIASAANFQTVIGNGMLMPKGVSPELLESLSKTISPSLQHKSNAKSQKLKLPSYLVNRIEQFGEIERVYLAEGQKVNIESDTNRIKEFNLDAKMPLVIHVQDAHEIYSVQKNIAFLIKEFMGLGVNVVGVEGAEGVMQGIEKWRNNPDQESLREVAGYLLRKGILTGVEVAGLSKGKGQVEFYGVEKKEKYLDQVKSFKETLGKNNEIKHWQDSTHLKIASLKARIYSEDLKRLDQTKQKYENGEIKLGDWAGALQEATSKTFGEEDRNFSNLAQYLNAYHIEKEIDFKIVEKKQRELLEKLTQKLSQGKLVELLQESLLYRLGSIGYAEFYNHLIERASLVDLKLTPEIKKYIQYLVKVEGIDREKLFEELKNFSDKVFKEKISANPLMAEVYELDKDFSLMNKGLNFSLNVEEWQDYLKREKELTKIPEKIAKLEGKNSQSEDQAEFQQVKEVLKNVEKFSRLSEERNGIFTSQLAERMKQKEQKISVLIAGGYHSSGIEESLKAKGVSFITVRPRMDVAKVDKEYHPLNGFKRGLIPLEKMFLPEKVSLASLLASEYPDTAKGIGAQGALDTFTPILSKLKGKKISGSMEKVIHAQQTGSIYKAEINRNGKVIKVWTPIKSEDKALNKKLLENPKETLTELNLLDGVDELDAGVAAEIGSEQGRVLVSGVKPAHILARAAQFVRKIPTQYMQGAAALIVGIPVLIMTNAFYSPNGLALTVPGVILVAVIIALAFIGLALLEGRKSTIIEQVEKPAIFPGGDRTSRFFSKPTTRFVSILAAALLSFPLGGCPLPPQLLKAVGIQSVLDVSDFNEGDLSELDITDVVRVGSFVKIKPESETTFVVDWKYSEPESQDEVAGVFLKLGKPNQGLDLQNQNITPFSLEIINGPSQPSMEIEDATPANGGSGNKYFEKSVQGFEKGKMKDPKINFGHKDIAQYAILTDRVDGIGIFFNKRYTAAWENEGSFRVRINPKDKKVLINKPFSPSTTPDASASISPLIKVTKGGDPTAEPVAKEMARIGRQTIINFNGTLRNGRTTTVVDVKDVLGGGFSLVFADAITNASNSYGVVVKPVFPAGFVKEKNDYVRVELKRFGRVVYDENLLERLNEADFFTTFIENLPQYGPIDEITYVSNKPMLFEVDANIKRPSSSTTASASPSATPDASASIAPLIQVTKGGTPSLEPVASEVVVIGRQTIRNFNGPVRNGRTTTVLDVKDVLGGGFSLLFVNPITNASNSYGVAVKPVFPAGSVRAKDDFINLELKRFGRVVYTENILGRLDESDYFTELIENLPQYGPIDEITYVSNKPVLFELDANVIRPTPQPSPSPTATPSPTPTPQPTPNVPVIARVIPSNSISVAGAFFSNPIIRRISQGGQDFIKTTATKFTLESGSEIDALKVQVLRGAARDSGGFGGTLWTFAAGEFSRADRTNPLVVFPIKADGIQNIDIEIGKFGSRLFPIPDRLVVSQDGKVYGVEINLNNLPETANRDEFDTIGIFTKDMNAINNQGSYIVGSLGYTAGIAVAGVPQTSGSPDTSLGINVTLTSSESRNKVQANVKNKKSASSSSFFSFKNLSKIFGIGLQTSNPWLKNSLGEFLLGFVGIPTEAAPLEPPINPNSNPKPNEPLSPQTPGPLAGPEVSHRGSSKDEQTDENRASRNNSIQNGFVNRCLELLYQKLEPYHDQIKGLLDQRQNPESTLTKQEIDKRIQKIVDKINASEFVDVKEGDYTALPDELNPEALYQKFIDSEDHAIYVQKVEDLLLRGEISFHLMFGGAATRLGVGSMFGLDLIDVADGVLKTSDSSGTGNTNDRNLTLILKAIREMVLRKKKSETEKTQEKVAEKLTELRMAVQHAKNSLPEETQKLTLAQRQLWQYRYLLEKIGKLKGYSQDQIQTIIFNLPMVLYIDENHWEEVKNDFIQNNFYGLNPEKIYFIRQPYYPLYQYKTGKLEQYPGEEELPFGHGSATLSLYYQKGWAFQLNWSGEEKLVDESVSTILGNQGVDMAVYHRLNDLTMINGGAIDLHWLAFVLYQLEHGHHFVGELVTNSDKQKGGNAIFNTNTGKPMLIETVNSNGSKELNKLVTELSESGAPYNKFTLGMSMKEIWPILEGDSFSPPALRANVRYKDGHFTVDIITGDISQDPRSNPLFFFRNEAIHDFKDLDQLAEALAFVNQQERDEDFVNFLKRELMIFNEQFTQDEYSVVHQFITRLTKFLSGKRENEQLRFGFQSILDLIISEHPEVREKIVQIYKRVLKKFFPGYETSGLSQVAIEQNSQYRKALEMLIFVLQRKAPPQQINILSILRNGGSTLYSFIVGFIGLVTLAAILSCTAIGLPSKVIPTSMGTGQSQVIESVLGSTPEPLVSDSPSLTVSPTPEPTRTPSISNDTFGNVTPSPVPTVSASPSPAVSPSPVPTASAEPSWEMMSGRFTAKFETTYVGGPFAQTIITITDSQTGEVKTVKIDGAIKYSDFNKNGNRLVVITGDGASSSSFVVRNFLWVVNPLDGTAMKAISYSEKYSPFTTINGFVLSSDGRHAVAYTSKGEFLSIRLLDGVKISASNATVGYASNLENIENVVLESKSGKDLIFVQGKLSDRAIEAGFELKSDGKLEALGVTGGSQQVAVWLTPDGVVSAYKEHNRDTNKISLVLKNMYKNTETKVFLMDWLGYEDVDHIAFSPDGKYVWVKRYWTHGTIIRKQLWTLDVFDYKGNRAARFDSDTNSSPIFSIDRTRVTKNSVIIAFKPAIATKEKWGTNYPPADTYKAGDPASVEIPLTEATASQNFRTNERTKLQFPIFSKDEISQQTSLSTKNQDTSSNEKSGLSLMIMSLIKNEDGQARIESSLILAILAIITTALLWMCAPVAHAAVLLSGSASVSKAQLFSGTNAAAPLNYFVANTLVLAAAVAAVVFVVGMILYATKDDAQKKEMDQALTRLAGVSAIFSAIILLSGSMAFALPNIPNLLGMAPVLMAAIVAGTYFQKKILKALQKFKLVFGTMALAILAACNISGNPVTTPQVAISAPINVPAIVSPTNAPLDSEGKVIPVIETKTETNVPVAIVQTPDPQTQTAIQPTPQPAVSPTAPTGWDMISDKFTVKFEVKQANIGVPYYQTIVTLRDNQIGKETIVPIDGALKYSEFNKTGNRLVIISKDGATPSSFVVRNFLWVIDPIEGNAEKVIDIQQKYSPFTDLKGFVLSSNGKYAMVYTASDLRVVRLEDRTQIKNISINVGYMNLFTGVETVALETKAGKDFIFANGQYNDSLLEIGHELETDGNLKWLGITAGTLKTDYYYDGGAKLIRATLLDQDHLKIQYEKIGSPNDTTAIEINLFSSLAGAQADHVAFSPDGKTLWVRAHAGNDQMLVLLEPNGNELRRFNLDSKERKIFSIDHVRFNSNSVSVDYKPSVPALYTDTKPGDQETEELLLNHTVQDQSLQSSESSRISQSSLKDRQSLHKTLAILAGVGAVVIDTLKNLVSHALPTDASASIAIQSLPTAPAGFGSILLPVLAIVVPLALAVIAYTWLTTPSVKMTKTLAKVNDQLAILSRTLPYMTQTERDEALKPLENDLKTIYQDQGIKKEFGNKDIIAEAYGIAGSMGVEISEDINRYFKAKNVEVSSLPLDRLFPEVRSTYLQDWIEFKRMEVTMDQTEFLKNIKDKLGLEKKKELTYQRFIKNYSYGYGKGAVVQVARDTRIKPGKQAPNLGHGVRWIDVQDIQLSFVKNDVQDSLEQIEKEELRGLLLLGKSQAELLKVLDEKHRLILNQAVKNGKVRLLAYENVKNGIALDSIYRETMRWGWKGVSVDFLTNDLNRLNESFAYANMIQTVLMTASGMKLVQGLVNDVSERALEHQVLVINQ
ncbi:MAG: hypothetical protein HYT97_06000 [Elusimicrobia bacterium]|nr:hypothetical protein [Elusimicrobiota bacterium]